MRIALLGLVVLVCAGVLPAVSQEIDAVEKVVPVLNGFSPVTNPEWGSDVLIANSEPVGRPSGAGRSSGTAFIAVPDTGIISGRSTVVYRTTNFGNTWSVFTSISPTRVVQKTKMVRGANDSLYLFYLAEGVVRYWNVETPTIRVLDSTRIRDFDVVTSNTGGLYLFWDANYNNDIRAASSATYGEAWTQRIFLSSTGAFPRLFLNNLAASDTIIINYYGPVRTDTARSIIRQARYRETAPGTISSAGFSNVDIDTANYRTEFGSAKLGNVVWFFNSKGLTGSIDIQCKVSTDAGVTFGTPFNVAANPNVDEYWFDLKNYSLSVSNEGLDIIYYSDSLGSVVSNATDKVMYAFIRRSAPSTVSGLTQLSEHPPIWSERGYIPANFEYYDAGGESGVIWVGLDAGLRKVYYDRYNATPTSVNPNGGGVPETYSLQQNYPNPFNPATTIEFTIPKSEFVTLRVYDLLGKEVQTLVAENLNSGTHKTRFDAGRFASGVYMYKLQAGKYFEAKKLMFVK
ncbi:MAG TPA: hypothetical protein DGH68_07130 [Bacteroidetes bacterium]|nr:hypothetical protein [Bacteroidota bacterium]